VRSDYAHGPKFRLEMLEGFANRQHPIFEDKADEIAFCFAEQ
jgi:hypothetical protein